jgi:biotin synthase-related radical SAM superfamily protein
MGESELEILDAAQRIHDMGGHNHMFAFSPERASLMEDRGCRATHGAGRSWRDT